MLNYYTSCLYCSKNFTITNSKQLYCSDFCQSKAGYKVCPICNKEFENPNNQETCSFPCCNLYAYQDNIIEPIYINKDRKCLTCHKEFSGERDYCSLACAHGLEKRTGFTIARPEMFKDIFHSAMLSNSKIVVKPWGGEVHIVNHNEYCLKYLIFFKNKQFSHHVHTVKKELWHCINGGFECVLEKDGVKKCFIFNTGEKLEIEPGVIHQLQALEDSILVEVSTRDFPEDSYRIIPGIN